MTNRDTNPTDTRGPWPGPRPYREADRHRFFGRDDEKYDLLERLDAERLVLLTAPSAVGKTSFLRASIVPELRRRRRKGLEQGQSYAHPAVIVVRDWPVPDLAETTDSFFIEAIAEGIRDLNEEIGSYGERDAAWIRADHDVLAAVPREGTAFGYITSLAAATDGLTIVFDQFEESLQGSPEHIRRVAALVNRLFSRAEHVNLLLSFREEFLTKFNTIGREVGDLNKRMYYLQAIAERTLRESVLQSANAGEVSLAPDALDELLSWMDSANRDDNSRRSSHQRVGRSKAVVQLSGSRNLSIDLLKLQALLLQLYAVAAREAPEGDIVTITTETLHQLRREASGSEELVDGPEMVERALQRFVDSLLPLPDGVVGSSGLPSHRELTQEEERMLRRRRAAVRMGPSFSSGGFKVQQEQAALLARAWREEWEVLDMEVNEVEDALRETGDLDIEEDHLFEGILKDFGENFTFEQRSAPALSGPAKRHGWDIRAGAVDLIMTALEALDLLREGNVLRRKSLQGQVTYELVHDGFGDAVLDWAEETRIQPIDALTATTAERGAAFRWTRLTGRVSDVRFRGCWIGPDRARIKRLVIDAVTFENCDLRGTVFQGCDFKGGSFRDCDLGGAVFWNCTFEGTEQAPFLFDGVIAGGLNFDELGSMRHVRFYGNCRLHNMLWNRITVQDVTVEHCTINQMKVMEVSLNGTLWIQGCGVLLSDLAGLSAADGQAESMLRISESDIFYCRLGQWSEDAVDSNVTNQLYPDPDLVGPEPELRQIARELNPWIQPT